ncbi:TRAM domain-containing protein, partial [Microbacteriaceae bacterium K1510]|nr:TRAM domain-containing protein [Microbacteriaceae bacterium K1510]
PRAGTPAAEMADSVPEEVKSDRLQRLMDVQNKISREKNLALEGQVLEVLIEGESKTNPEVLAGRTRTGKLVHIKGDHSLIGKM